MGYRGIGDVKLHILLRCRFSNFVRHEFSELNAVSRILLELEVLREKTERLWWLIATGENFRGD